MTGSARPFEGIRIVDATHVLAGPFATYQLAALGADVIKVEHPTDADMSRDSGVDPALNERGMGTLYLTQASNKRSLTLDLKAERGREVMLRLVETADVLVENYRPGAFDALGLGYDVISKLNPRLIYCSMSAFGQTGPRAHQTAYDHVVQAASGIMYSTGTPDVTPLKIGPPAIDYATGTMGAFALASALFQRERTGLGQRIDLAMVDVAQMLMGSQLTGFMMTGRPPRAIGNQLQHATNCAYATADGLLMVGAGNLRQQQRLWTALERPEMIKRTSAERDADRDNEMKVLAELLLARTAAEWEDFLQARHVPASRVRTLTEAMDDPQRQARAVTGRHKPDHLFANGLEVPLAAFKFAHGGPALSSSPPELGQHTDGILAELGYDTATIASLREGKAI